MKRKLLLFSLAGIFLLVCALPCSSALDLPYDSTYTLTDADREESGWLDLMVRYFDITYPIPHYTDCFDTNVGICAAYYRCDFEPLSTVEKRFEAMGRKDGIAILGQGPVSYVMDIGLRECQDCGRHFAHLTDSAGNWDKDAHIHKVLRRSLEGHGPCFCLLCGEQVTEGRVVFQPDEDDFGTIVYYHEPNLTPVLRDESYRNVFLYAKALLRSAVALPVAVR